MKRTAMLVAATMALAGIGAQAQTAPAGNQQTQGGPPSVTALTMMASNVPSSDVDKSIDFYTKGLGLTLGGKVEMGAVAEVPLMMPGGGTYLMLQHPHAAEAALPVRNMLNRILLISPDLKALEARLTAAGYHLDGKGINEQTQYHIAVAQLADPDGNRIEIIQRLK